MYEIISLIGTLIRQFLLPNPYIKLFSNETYADLFNIFVGGVILHIMSYYLTGVIYERKSAPGLGSLLYLLNYSWITAMIIIISKLISNIYISIFTCLIIYIVVLLILSHVYNKNKEIINF